MHAAGRRDYAKVGRLIATGTNVNSADPSGVTALHYAVKKNDTRMVTILLQAHANPNVRTGWGETPLLNAIRNANSYLITALLDAGADVNTGNAFNETALGLAISARNQSLVKMLLDNGAAVTPSQGTSPLIHAIRATASIEMVKMLLDAGANINDTCIITELKAFALAASYSRISLLDLFLSRGADINCTDSTGDTALHRASRHNISEVVKYLLKTGADIHRVNLKGETPLSIGNKLVVRHAAKSQVREIALALRHTLPIHPLLAVTNVIVGKALSRGEQDRILRVVPVPRYTRFGLGHHYSS